MAIPDFQTLALSIQDHVATVALNRPEKANSMNTVMWPELQTCFEWLDAAPEVRVVILSGNGKHFCAGLDLAMFSKLKGASSDPARQSDEFRRNVLRMQDNLSAIERCRKPVLAAIHNTCIGGGVDLVCCCDMRYATEDAWFAIREIDIGMTADVGTLQRMPKLVADGIVRELAYTGRNLGAHEAREIGFVNRVFPDQETLLREVTEIARSIASKSPLAVRGTKEMILYTRDHSVQDGLNYIATWNAGMLSQVDLMAGVSAQATRQQAPDSRSRGHRQGAKARLEREAWTSAVLWLASSGVGVSGSGIAGPLFHFHEGVKRQGNTLVDERITFQNVATPHKTATGRTGINSVGDVQATDACEQALEFHVVDADLQGGDRCTLVPVKICGHAATWALHRGLARDAMPTRNTLQP